MVRPHNELGSLRFSRLEKERLLIALLFSLFAHLGVWGTYEAGKKAGIWQKIHWPDHRQLAVLQPRVVPPPVDPAIFLDVSQASADAPKTAKYYSDKNSRAANPDTVLDSNQPKLNGKQRDMPKTEDEPRLVKAKLNSPPAPSAKPAELRPGGLQPAKPADVDTPERPRTIREAMAQSRQVPGLTLKQEGGVKRNRLIPSFDAKATPFGAYDAAVFEAIQQYWNDELDNHQYAGDRTGRVTITFDLNADGGVSNLKIVKSEIDILLSSYCQESIERTAPYGKWPDDMLRMIGSTKRPITITFIYY